jgi:hypothetical protein
VSNEAPSEFLTFNTQSTKQINIVVEIEGVPGLLTAQPLYTRLRYGDPGVHYGDPGLVYGGLRPLSTFNGGLVQDIMSLDASSLTLQQRIEPEQGRASISVLSFGFIDKDQYMTRLCSPGIIVDDILGKKIKVYLGYKEISFPEDYYVVYRGIISSIDQPPGLVKFTLSDPNIKRRSQVFYAGKTTTTTSITDVQTTIPVVSNGDFFKPLTGPSGAYDSGVKYYLQIADEVIEYGPSFSLPSATFGTNSFAGVVRGSRGSVAVAHDAATDVTNLIEISGHAIDIALKVMLSGWNGPCIEGVVLQGINLTQLLVPASYPNSLVLPPNKDANRDYGIYLGDYLTVSGSAVPANNQTCVVIGFQDLNGEPNRVILTTGTFTNELATTGVMAIRSQYDVYPLTCGTQLSVDEVDVQRHLELKAQFLSVEENAYSFLITGPETGKTWIESEIYLPIACYSLTRFGRLSVGLTKPPLADDRLQFLTKDNITNADRLAPQRSITNRKYFNEIDWSYDVLPDGSTFTTVLKALNTDSLNTIGLSSVLPITSKGLRSSLNPDAVIQRRTKFLLNRYAKGAILINPEVNYEVGCQIEAGDIVALQDNGALQIANYGTGIRNLGVQLFEVTGRTLDLRNGNAKLELLSGVGGQADDRFGTISPSSRTAAGVDLGSVIITDSYGAKYPGNEAEKYADYIGQKIVIHSDDWSVSYERTLTGFDNINTYKMLLSPNLPSIIPADYVVDIPAYPTDVDPYTNQVFKQIHAFLDPRVVVSSGASTTSFVVSSGDISKFIPNAILLVHEPDWSYKSPEVAVDSVDTGTNTVTVKQDLGFTPTAGDYVELIGFSDKGPAYRWI